jgi:hypothetical protein
MNKFPKDIRCIHPNSNLAFPSDTRYKVSEGTIPSSFQSQLGITNQADVLEVLKILQDIRESGESVIAHGHGG